MTKPVSAVPARAGDLEALLELERTLAQRLAAARAEADRILEDARADVAKREAALEAELAASAEELRTRLTAERDRRLAAVAEDGRQRAAAWDGAADSAVVRAAGMVADALIAGPRAARR
jgi:vacuolar-type H+-ATPase subunit H